MNCSDLRQLIPLNTAGLLTEKEKTQLAAHLEHCETCRHTMENEQLFQSDLDSFFNSEAFPKELDSLENQVSESLKTKAKFFSFLKSTAAAVIAFAITTLIILNQPPLEPVIVQTKVEPLIRELNIRKVSIVKPEFNQVNKPVKIKKLKDNIVLITLKN